MVLVQRVAGSALLDQRKVMEALVGEATVTKALARLPAAQRDEYNGLTALSWCLSSTAEAVLRAVAEESRQDMLELQANVVRAGVERTVRSIWRVLLTLTSDDAIIRRAPLMYSKGYQVGRMQSRVTAPGSAEFEISGWPGIPQLDVEALTVGIATVLRVSGRKNVDITSQRTADGVVLSGTWKKE